MKKFFLPILSVCSLICCEKIDDLKFSRVVQGGCFLEKSKSSANALSVGKDTVYYNNSIDSLEIFLGFNSTCCGEFNTDSEIKGDSILIKVNSTQIGLCNCLCYYTYNFKFIGDGKNYKYKVTVDDNLIFTGQIKP